MEVGLYDLPTLEVSSSSLLAKIFDAETKIPNRDALPNPPSSIIKKSTKLPRAEDQTAPPPRVDPDEEYNNR